MKQDFSVRIDRPPPITDQTLWNPGAEALDRVAVYDLQWKRLKRQLNYCYERSEFYRDKLDSVGAHPNDIQEWRDFRSLPVLLTKEEQRESQERSLQRDGHPYGTYVCAPLDTVVGAYTTSGTTGSPTFYLFTDRDFAIHAEITARIFWRAGLRPGDTLIWAFGTGAWVAGSIPPCFRKMGVRSVNVGLEGGSEAVLRFAELTRAETLVATPSLLEYLVERSPEILGKPIGALPIRRLISGGEPGAGLPETRQMLVTTFDAELFDFIGPTSQFGYVSCLSPEYQGMHNVAADLHVWAEDLVDPETKEPIDVTDGVIGEGYMTDLAREAGPVLKYAYGDILQVFTEPCGCGLPGNRIKMLSRADDMLIVKGVNVYPSAVKSVIEGFQPRTTGAMRIVLTQPPPMVPPPLRLVVELGGGTDQQDQSTLRDHIRAKLHYQLRFTPEIDFVAANTLHRSEKKTDLFDRRYVRDQ